MAIGTPARRSLRKAPVHRPQSQPPRARADRERPTGYRAAGVPRRAVGVVLASHAWT
jgi:hypothetical protein